MNAKYLLFIAVLVFGGLLLAYTASRFFSTQKKITEKQTSLDKTADIASSVKRKIDLWVYYFKGGNDKSPVMKIIFTYFWFVMYLIGYILRLNQRRFVLYLLSHLLYLFGSLDKVETEKCLIILFLRLFRYLIQLLRLGLGYCSHLIDAVKI